MPDRHPILPSAVEISRRLRDDLGYSVQGADAVIAELALSRDEVRTAFADWWFTGSLDTLEVEGWTAEKIVAQLGCLPPAAVLNLGWLLDEPLAARAALQRGFDRIICEGEGMESADPKKNDG